MIRSARDDAGERLNGHRSGLAPITEEMTKLDGYERTIFSSS